MHAARLRRLVPPPPPTHTSTPPHTRPHTHTPTHDARRGGFFEGDDDFCQALVDGGCVKALALQLARDVEGAQFVEALEEALAPRMRLAGGERRPLPGCPASRVGARRRPLTTRDGRLHQGGG
jgi:hypothetical protein